MKRQVCEQWERDQHMKQVKREKMEAERRAAHKARLELNKKLAEERAQQKKAKSDLRRQIREERLDQLEREQNAKMDRMIVHTEHALSSAMADKQREMTAVQAMEDDWAKRVADRHSRYSQSWNEEQRILNMFRQQRNKQVGRWVHKFS